MRDRNVVICTDMVMDILIELIDPALAVSV